ncbi:MAG: hypothetical protein ACRDA4_10535 [Filifactoraceae bacterium]
MKQVVFDSCDLFYGDFKDITNIDTLITKLTPETRLATSDGGVKFACTHDIHDIPFAKLNGKKVKGNQRVLKVEASIEGEVLVINKKLLDMSLFRTETNTSTKYDVYRPVSGVIEDAKYKDLVLVGTGVTGQDLLVLLHNTYNSEFAIDSSDGDEAKSAVKFEAHYDKADLNKVPVEVLVLKDTAPATLSEGIK